MIMGATLNQDTDDMDVLKEQENVDKGESIQSQFMLKERPSVSISSSKIPI